MSLEIDTPATVRSKVFLGYVLFGYVSTLGYVLDMFWLRFGCAVLILITFWLRSILVTFWLRFGYVLVAYSQGSGPTQRSTPGTNRHEDQEDSTRSMNTRSGTSTGTIASISPILQENCAAHLKRTSPVWELCSH